MAKAKPLLQWVSIHGRTRRATPFRVEALYQLVGRAIDKAFLLRRRFEPGASVDKYRGPDARPVVDRKSLAVKYDPARLTRFLVQR